MSGGHGSGSLGFSAQYLVSSPVASFSLTIIRNLANLKEMT